MALKLFVGNLSRTATDDALSEFVNNAGFRAASTVVIRDRGTGDSKGFGFVELAEGEDLERAIRELSGQALDGRPLTVNEARPQSAGFAGGRGGGGGRPGGGGRGGFNKRKRDW